MKLLATLIIVIASITLVNAAPITGKSHSTFGKYSISENKTINQSDNSDTKTFVLNYQNSKEPFKVRFIKDTKCRTFVITSDNFEISYCCNKGVFGVKRTCKKNRNISAQTTSKYLDRQQYLHQRIITQRPKTDKELLGLIACYLPNLIKKEYSSAFLANS